MSDNTTPILTGPALETRFAPDEGVIEGFLARYGETDAHGEQFAPGAFRKALAEIKASGNRVPLLWQHLQGEPVGSWHELRETPEGVYGVARINTDVARGREALSLVKRGDLSGLSVGFIVPPGGRKGSTIVEAILMECSLVSIPSASRARIKLKDFASLNDFAEALTSGAPLSRKDAEFVARKTWPALNGPDPEQAKTIDLLARRIEAATLSLKGM